MRFLIFSLLLTSCARTEFWEGGQRVARFQGDMAGVTYERTPDGAVRWRADSVDHSSATRAQGEAAAGKINAAGAAVAAAGITALLK